MQILVGSAAHIRTADELHRRLRRSVTEYGDRVETVQQHLHDSAVLDESVGLVVVVVVVVVVVNAQN